MKKIFIGLLAVLGLVVAFTLPTTKANTPSADGAITHRISLKGASNVRDLGGYKTTTHYKIKPRLLLRSAKLANLTSNDKKILTGRYHLKTDIDLRTPSVMKSTPDAKISGVRLLKNPVLSDSTMASVNRVAKTSGSQSMVKMYQYFVTTKQARKAYRTLFVQLLKAPSNHAVLWHCSAGKDRTGFASALVLTALGVSKTTVYQDYLSSNTYNQSSNNMQLAVMRLQGASKKAIANKKDSLVVKKAYLDAAYKAATKKYGSLQGYLTKGLGLSKTNISQLKHHYLMK